MEKRLGTLSIFIKDRNKIKEVNNILSDYSDIIIGRLGLPYHLKDVSVIVLILDGTNDKIGALSGKLGTINGINVKTALAKQ